MRHYTKIPRAMAWISGTTGIASIIFGFIVFLKPESDHTRTLKLIEAIILSAWIVLPPTWFWVEFFFLWPIESRNFKDDEKYKTGLDEFKYGQDVASKIWIAVVTLLFVLYFGKDIPKIP